MSEHNECAICCAAVVPPAARKRNVPPAVCSNCKPLLGKKPRTHRRGRKRDRVVPGCTQGEWVTTLRRSWSITGDCFRCELSGLRLDTQNTHSPLALTCDHDPPGSPHVLIVAWVINDMKNDHDRQEFYRNVQCLAEMVKGSSPRPDLADKYEANFSNMKHWRRK